MLKQIEVNIDVLTAAKQRIINIFSNNAKVYLSFSGGKDSICLGHIVYELVRTGRVNKDLLHVVFIDEEAMYDEVIDIVKAWRKKFLMLGVRFDWYCLETKHFNCLNTLQDEETFITWDRYAEGNWIRTPPSFAIRNHPLLDARKDSYQEFLEKLTRDGFQMIGSRTAESVQRLINMSHVSMGSVSSGRRFYPIYDWKTDDVWYYLYINHLDIPITYLQMYQVGVNKNNLRISQFFAIDTVRSLISMQEFNPNLMQRIERRQPNAYLACLYFDSEMFARKTRTRAKIEAQKPEEQKDYRKMFINYLYDDRNFETDHQKKVQRWYKNRLMKFAKFSPTPKNWQDLYEAVLSGDTKLRKGRAISMKIMGDHNRDGLK